VTHSITRIERSDGWVGLRLRELFEFRGLLYFLTWRDIKVRYKQTVLGALWAILQPVLTMVVFTLFFGRLARMPSDGVPYHLFSLTALVPWTFFANGMTAASNSLVGSANIIKKIYFPRLALPMSAVLGGIVDFVLAFIVLIGMLLAGGVVPTINIIWLPLFVLLAFVTALGVSLWLSALNVQFRDVRYVVPFIIQLWMFSSPIVYPASLIEDPVLRVVYAFNPMVGVIEGFRWSLLGTETAPTMMTAVSVLVALAMLFGGAFYFRRMEKTFADVV